MKIKRSGVAAVPFVLGVGFLIFGGSSVAGAQNPGVIIVEKQTVPDGSPQGFEFSTSYGPNFVLADDETNNSGPLTAGFYAVAEVNIPPGWSLTSATCDDGSDPSTIGLDSGETVTCTFLNDQLVGTIIVEKQTDPDGAPDVFTFNGDAAGAIRDGEQIVLGNLQPGTYSSTETVPASWSLMDITCDDANSTGDVGTATATFQLEAGETVKCTFSNRQTTDYGDAPDSYGTLLASNGARHSLVAGHHLGPIVDGEPDGQPSPIADSDDLNPVGAADDEDGVVLPATLIPGTTAAFDVDGGPSGGLLDVWFDFDANGVFDHPAEHLFGGTSLAIAPGPNPPVSFPVPSGAVMGPTFTRFRLSINGGLMPTGFAPDGEVEDYVIDTVPVELMRFTVE
jgi:hypothetical protein